jgi:hypothetical protein
MAGVLQPLDGIVHRWWRMIVLFKDGVFAWNGLLPFWIEAVVFGLWLFVMAWQLLTAARADDGPVPGQPDVDTPQPTEAIA